jgi:hypothetical protein
MAIIIIFPGEVETTTPSNINMYSNWDKYFQNTLVSMEHAVT